MRHPAIDGLPEVFFQWVGALAAIDWPDETLADCPRCPLAGAPGAPATVERPFQHGVGCCTYHPTLLNFAAGRALRAGGEGAQLVRARIAAGSGVGRLGIEASDFWPEQLRLARAGQATRRCPYHANGCSIHAHRPRFCRTWYCRSTAGDAGQRAWEALERVLTDVEQHLATACVAAVPEDADWEAYYLACADVADRGEVAPPPVPLEAVEVISRQFGAPANVLVPSAPPFVRDGATVRFATGIPHDRQLFPAAVFPFLAALDGRPWRDALAGTEVDEATVLDLWRSRIVSDPSAPSVTPPIPLPARVRPVPQWPERTVEGPVHALAEGVLTLGGAVCVVSQVPEPGLRETILATVQAHRAHGELLATDDPQAHFSPDNPHCREPFVAVNTTGIAATFLDSGHVVHNWRSQAIDRLSEWMAVAARALARAHGVDATYELETAWCTVTRAGGRMDWHEHDGDPEAPVDRVAAVFYASVGDANLPDAEAGCVEYALPTSDTSGVLRPADGFLTVFPAHALHRVLPYGGTAERVIVAANLGRRAG